MRLTRREFNRLLALSLGLGATGLPALSGGAGAAPTPTGLDPALPLHPLLQYGALVQPDKKVAVILQKTAKDGNGKEIAADGEGEDLEEFAFIKSHRMVVKQGRLPRLAARADVLYISPDSGVRRHAVIDPAKLLTTFPRTVNADQVWNAKGTGTTGKGVTVAVLDTGLTIGADFDSRVIAVNLNSQSSSVADKHGHGTHVAGIIKGRSANGAYVGIAPDSTLISVKIADDQGVADTGDLLRGLQWAYINRAGFNGSPPIQVVNISISVATPESYKTSAVCAAVEQLWLAGIVVVCAAGNNGTAPDATWCPPANDPYVITVGATDEAGTEKTDNDTLATFSSRGKTQDGVYKPEIVAPGRRIVAPLASADCAIAKLYPERLTGDGHIRLTGTSMSAPIVAGTVVLLRACFPNLTPDQIKWLLQSKGIAYKSPDGVPIVGAQQAIQWAANTGNTIGKANLGLQPSLGLIPTANGVNVTQAYWDQAYWDQAYWDQAYWDQAYWDQAYWDTAGRPD
jgi:serine protease AprX